MTFDVLLKARFIISGTIFISASNGNPVFSLGVGYVKVHKVTDDTLGLNRLQHVGDLGTDPDTSVSLLT